VGEYSIVGICERCGFDVIADEYFIYDEQDNLICENCKED